MIFKSNGVFFYSFKSFGTLKFSPKRRLGGSAPRHEVPDQPLLIGFFVFRNFFFMSSATPEVFFPPS